MGRQHDWKKIKRIRRDIPNVKMWLWICSNCKAETWTQGDFYPVAGDETNSRCGHHCPPTVWERLS